MLSRYVLPQRFVRRHVEPLHLGKYSRIAAVAQAVKNRDLRKAENRIVRIGMRGNLRTYAFDHGLCFRGKSDAPQQRNIYRTIGGTPFLDMNYTVFGEVVEGLSVIDRIASVRTNREDRPLEDVRIISVRVEE